MGQPGPLGTPPAPRPCPRKPHAGLRGERVSSAHAKQRRGDWLGELPGRARAAAPRPPPTASPTPCRGTRHPSSTQGSTRLPGRMLQGNGPPGLPNKVRAGRTRTVGVTVPSAGHQGKPVAPALPPVLVCQVGRDGAMPHPALVKRLFSPPLLVPRFPWRGSRRTCALARLWSRLGHSLLETPMAAAAAGFPGHPVLGTGAGWGDSGDGRGQRAPRSCGLPPRGGWELGGLRLGGDSDHWRDAQTAFL